VRALPPTRSPRPADLLLDGLALLVTDGPAAAAPVLRQAVTTFASGNIPREEGLASSWLAARCQRAASGPVTSVANARSRRSAPGWRGG
jgi:hypothetical protein